LQLANASARTALAGALCAVALWTAGCGGGVTGNDGRPTLAETIIGADPDTTFFEADQNNLFEEAQLVLVTGENTLIRGHVSGSRDVDVYDLGPMRAGDRVRVEMVPDAGLNGAIAVFDDNLACKLVNDHRNVYLGVKEPFIDVVFERASESCYIAVASTPTQSSSGDYAMIASKFGDSDPLELRSDVVLLNFEGGSGVRIGSRSAIEVPRFDATSISSRYAGQTDDIIAATVARIRADFVPYDVTILSTSEGASADALTTILFFGTFDEALLGVAEGVDEFNATQAQQAIVFTDTFAAFDPLEPSAEEMSQALANVASHEIGHLLGLVHTSDPQGIMDITASLSQLLDDQDFTMSALHGDVFPLGSQDAVQSLADALGGDAELGRALAQTSELDIRSLEQAVTTRARSVAHFSTCSLDH